MPSVMSDNLLNIGTRIESALPAKTIIDIGLLEYRMFGELTLVGHCVKESFVD